MPRHVTELDLAGFVDDSTTSGTTTWSSSKIVSYVAAEIGDIAVIDDGTVVGDKTWSSNKINVTVNTAVAGRIPTIASPASGNFPVMNSSGNLVSSSSNAGSFATVSHNHNVLNLTGFPSLSGQTGRFLSNDGGALLWSVINKTTVGLSNVDNTSDANKPISTAVASALAGKANTSHAHTVSQVSDFPSQTGNNGRVLGTDGTTLSWVEGGGLPSQTGNAGRILTTNGTTPSWMAIPGATVYTWQDNDGSGAINWNLGNAVKIVAAGNLTLSFSNPASAIGKTLMIEITASGANRTIALPTGHKTNWRMASFQVLAGLQKILVGYYDGSNYTWSLSPDQGAIV